MIQAEGLSRDKEFRSIEGTNDLLVYPNIESKLCLF